MNDSIIKKLFKDTLVIEILTALTAVLGGVVDGIVTGSLLGTKYMASFGIALPIVTIFSGISGVFSSGISILCGNSIGSGDKEKTNSIFAQCITAAIITGILMCIITFLGAEPIAKLLGAKADLLPETVAYLKAFSFSGPAIILTVALLPVMQIDGDRNRALNAIVITTVVNISLDLLNGFVLHKGLFVMALATTISYYAGAMILMMHFRKEEVIFKFTIMKIRFNVFKDMIVYGLPNALQQISRSMLTICLNRIILMVANSNAIAAYTAIFTASTVCMAIGTGIGQSTSIITGVLAGERDIESLEKLIKNAIRTALLLDLIVLAVMFIGSPIFMRCFLQESKVLSIAIVGFRIYSVSIIFYALNVTLRSYYQAMHEILIAYPYVVLDNFLCIAASAFVLGKIFGIKGIWFSFVVGEILTLVIIMIFVFITSKEKTLIKKIMHIKKNFLDGIIAVHSWSCNNQELVMKASTDLYDICIEEGSTPKTAFYLSLSLEEMCINIIQHGFKDNKNHSIDVKAIRKKSGWILRIRDNCSLFDPLCYLENYDYSDKISHIGIKMINKMSKHMEYVNTLKLNNTLIEICE